MTDLLSKYMQRCERESICVTDLSQSWFVQDGLWYCTLRSFVDEGFVFASGSGVTAGQALRLAYKRYRKQLTSNEKPLVRQTSRRVRRIRRNR